MMKACWRYEEVIITVIIFRSPYFVLLEFSEDKCYLYLFIILIYLRLPRDRKSLLNPVNLASHSNTMRFNTKIIVSDSILKRAYLISTYMTITVEVTMRLLLYHVWKLYMSKLWTMDLVLFYFPFLLYSFILFWVSFSFLYFDTGVTWGHTNHMLI